MSSTVVQQLQEARALCSIRDFIRFGASRSAEAALFLAMAPIMTIH